VAYLLVQWRYSERSAVPSWGGGGGERERGLVEGKQRERERMLVEGEPRERELLRKVCQYPDINVVPEMPLNIGSLSPSTQL
jgi:hypothetical protein